MRDIIFDIREYLPSKSGNDIEWEEVTRRDGFSLWMSYLYTVYETNTAHRFNS